ncbi:MAG: HAD family phosphatase [Planctomycetia bacterium]|nr:HAD family phosphatase [Planctomycetia bacterium]
MPKSPLTTLFLDVGGVLLTNGWDRHARGRAAERFGLDPVQLDERHHLNFDTYEVGKQTLDEYMRRVIFYEPRDFSVDEFRQFMFDQSQRLPHMIELVTALKHRHRLKIAVVSNEGRELTLHRVEKFELGQFVDFFIFSCFVHLRKPDPDIFRLALDVAQVSPQEVAFLDDRDMFASIACGLGIHGIHHKSVEASQKTLAKLGLELDDAGPVAAPL